MLHKVYILLKRKNTYNLDLTGALLPNSKRECWVQIVDQFIVTYDELE